MKKKVLTQVVAGIMGIALSFSLAGCSSGSSTSLPPSSPYYKYQKSYDEIKESLKTPYYTYSAPVPGEMTEAEQKEYVSKLFDDVYVFVDPGAEALFVNDYKSSGESVPFYQLVAGQIDLFAQDLYQRLLNVYGTQTQRDDKVLSTPEILGDNTVEIQSVKTLVSTLDPVDSSYNVLSANDLTYLSELYGNIVDNPLRTCDAISGLNYQYTFSGSASDGFVYEDEGFISDSTYSWAYKNILDRDGYEIIKQNIAELLSGYTFDQLSTIYDSVQYTNVCKNVDHLGFLQFDKKLISEYLLKKVIGENNYNADNLSLKSMYDIYELPASQKDNTNGNIDYNSSSQVMVVGKLGCNVSYLESRKNNNQTDYQSLFVSAHNYKGYTIVVNTIVENASKELFTQGSSLGSEYAFTNLPRLNLLVVPMNYIDGTETTTFDENNVDWSDITTAVQFNPMIKDLKIQCMVLRVNSDIPKGVVPSGQQQYDEGIDVTQFEIVFYSDDYNADVSVTIEAKADGQEVLDEQGNKYAFTEDIVAQRYPTADPQYPSTTYTTLVDEQKAKNEWVGNNFKNYDGIDFETLLTETYRITPNEITVEGDKSYIQYTLPARLNAQSEYVYAVSNNLSESVYLPGYHLSTVSFGNNFLKVNLQYTNVSISSGDVEQDIIPITILTINPSVALWSDAQEKYMDNNE